MIKTWKNHTFSMIKTWKNHTFSMIRRGNMDVGGRFGAEMIKENAQERPPVDGGCPCAWGERAVTRLSFIYPISCWCILNQDSASALTSRKP